MKLGRLPRGRDLRIPHFSALLAGAAVPTAPDTCDYTGPVAGKPLGSMLNDSLGDCTCAGIGHAVQIWTANTEASMVTVPDSEVLALYEAVGKYNPADPSTDQGCVEQDVLKYLLSNSFAGTELAAFVEIDPRNLNDLKLGLYWCGIIYVGFNVPKYLTDSLEVPGSLWDVQPGADQSIVGGHCVIWPGYASNFKTISWGEYYEMTPAFVDAYVEEAYALVHPDWFKDGSTPLGMSVAQLSDACSALREAGT